MNARQERSLPVPVQPEFFRRTYPEGVSVFLPNVPRGWHRATSRYFDWVNTDSVRRARHGLVPLMDASAADPPQTEQFRRAAQEQRWFEGTGVRPQDSHFTVVIPILN